MYSISEMVLGILSKRFIAESISCDLKLILDAYSIDDKKCRRSFALSWSDEMLFRLLITAANATVDGF